MADLIAGSIKAHMTPQPFYEAAVRSIEEARESGQHRLFVAKLHGVAERRPEPKPKAPWVLDLMNAVGACIRDDWDVRIIERVESRDRLEEMITGVQLFDVSNKYQVKAALCSEGLPFLNVLLAGQGRACLALDDEVYRLARQGLYIEGGATQVLDDYWEDLWRQCPYWIRKPSGLYLGHGGVDDLRALFEQYHRHPAFVAMWFGDDAETKQFMTAVFETHLKPAIERAGYKAARVDLVPHTRNIMQQIQLMLDQAPLSLRSLPGNERVCISKRAMHSASAAK